MSFKIATRKSNLALAQTDYVINLLTSRFKIQCEKISMKTEGDRKLDVSLDKIGGKGVFIKDIEKALMEKRADAAVHSMKDMPNELLDFFQIIAMPVREDVRDVFISPKGIKFLELPKGALVGTSSIRRAVQIKNLRSDIKIVSIRGNIETRIKKMEENQLDGIVLAAAGIKRLGMTEIITEYFNPFEFIPAVGQGAIGVEILKNSEYAGILKKMDNEDVRIGVEAERSFLKELQGDCHAPVGAYSVIEGEILNITGIFQVGSRLVKKDVCGSKCDYMKLGKSLGEKILKG